jgi:hypothetical protein
MADLSRVDVRRYEQDATNLPIAMIWLDGHPVIVVEAIPDTSSPNSYREGRGSEKRMRIRPKLDGLDFEATISYWVLFLLKEPTHLDAVLRLERAA